MPSLRDLLHTMRPRDRRPAGPTAVPAEWAVADGRPRVVVENEDAVWQWAAARTLEAAGYAVACCGGPNSLAGEHCPLVTEDRCPLVDGADVVVNALGMSDPANRAVLTALRTKRDQLPVVAEVLAPQKDELDATIPGCTTVLFPARPAELVAAVDHVVHDRCRA